jgi:twinkle protein
MAAVGDERKRIDATMTKLRQLAQELNIGLHIVSHLRKSDGTPFEEGGQISLNDLRGSGAIAQLANLVIGLERDQQCDEGNQNVTKVRVLKNRFSGQNGVCGFLRYDPDTGRMSSTPDPSLTTNAEGEVSPATGEF